MEEKAIDRIDESRGPHYEPYGWHHWPEHPWMSYQFRRALGETQEGGGSISECFQAASRMTPGDNESWHAEWTRVGDSNRARGDEAASAGRIQTARNCWLRAADYYRSAEFWLASDDPRRLETFEKVEACSKAFLAHLTPPGEVVQVPYGNGAHLDAYFVPAPFRVERQPAVICFGGLDAYKDEMWFMAGRGFLQRGISVLMIDGPGQGGTLRRGGITSRHDYEAPVGRCIDYLEGRGDVDASRVAVCGGGIGGHFAARAACYEHRLAAALSHTAGWSLYDTWRDADEDHRLADSIKWVFGAASMKEAVEKLVPYTLEGHIGRMKCPYLIVHGGYDVLGVAQARKVYDAAKDAGINVTRRLVDEEETGADHCQHDNPTIGQEMLADWLAGVFEIDERELMSKTLAPIL